MQSKKFQGVDIHLKIHKSMFLAISDLEGCGSYHSWRHMDTSTTAVVAHLLIHHMNSQIFVEMKKEHRAKCCRETEHLAAIE